MNKKKDLSILARTAMMLSGTRRAAVMLLTVMLTMTAQTAWAAPGDTYIVDANGGGQYTTISAAVAAATGGETIFVKNGEYTETQPITIDKSLSIVGESGDGVVLNNIALRITDDDVTVTGLTLNEDGTDFTDNDGAAIYVNGSGVTLDGVSVTYNAPNEVEAKAIFADGADIFKLINSEITFTGANPGSEHYRGLEMRDCDEAIIDNNTISAVLPAVDVDWGEMGTIDQDLVLAVGIQGGEDVEFTKNIVTVNTNGSVDSYTTIDAVMIYSTNDILIKGNKITLLDTTPEDGARYYYSLDIYSTTGTVEANDITVNTTTANNDERAGTAYAIQVSGPSTVTIKDNNLTGISKGPIAGIYASNWNGAANLTVENNIIDVTGYTTTDNYWDLVAGIEAEIDVLKAYNNTITVANVADYDEAYPVYGVGSQYFYNDPPSADIRDNIITVDGQYAVNYAEAQYANVTGNALCAHELTGDAAVYIKSGNNNTVENNLLGYVIPKTGGITDAINDKLKGKTVNIVFSRTFDANTNGEGKASTLCLPFDLDKPSTTTVGTFYTFGGVSENSGEYVVTMNEVTATTLTAGTPYMIKPATTDPIKFQNTAYAVPNDGFTAASAATADGWEFHGTYEKKTWASGQTRLYGFAAADFEKTDGTPLNDVGSFQRYAWGYCDAFRCYLWAPDPNAARGVNEAGNTLPESMRVILVAADGTTTGIGTLDTKTGDVTFDGEAWYSLDGSRLSGKPTKKGLYINNGKKVVVK